MKKFTAFVMYSTVIMLATNAARCEAANLYENQHFLAVKSWLTSNQVSIAVGTRSLYVNLLADTKGRQMENSFIGSIYKIKADQEFFQIKPYVQLETPAGPVDLGVGLSYDAFDVATVDSGGGDGDIELRSWLFYLTAAWPNETRYKPFGEIGLYCSQNKFDPIPSWYADGRREFVLENEQSIYFAGGCEIAIDNNWSLNVYARYTDFDIQGKYIFRGDDRAPEPFHFTLEHLAYGLGAQYRF